MSWRRELMEVAVWLANILQPGAKQKPIAPPSIFVLRSNDIGDLLVITPLFQALRQQFPHTRIIAGIGNWNADVLRNNPYVDEIISVNAPWHNKFVVGQGLGAALRYIAFSPEIHALAQRHFDIGIDVLGSPFGSLLMLRAGIPYRLGVRGFAGGHTAVQQYVQFNNEQHVGQAALRFAELLGAKTDELPAVRPQLFLTNEERQQGEALWKVSKSGDEWPRRIVMAPGGGFAEKCWPLGHFRRLAKVLEQHDGMDIIVLGGTQDRATGEILTAEMETVRSLAGTMTLRETFACVAAADLVICNSSMLMHVAAAFHIRTIVVLGKHFVSAQQHARQWGYPENCIVCGQEGDKASLVEPEQVVDAVRHFSERRSASANEMTHR